MTLPIEPMPQHPDPFRVEAGAAADLRADEAPSSRRRRATPAQFLRDVEGELRRVAWPTRPTLISYSVVVLVALTLLVALIFGLNIGFQHLVSYLLTA